MSAFSGKGKWLVRLVPWAAVYVFFVRCVDDQITTPTRGPELVVRGWETTGPGCTSNVIKTTTDSTETVLATFTVNLPPLYTSCRPNLVPWGIDLSDPLGVDTPQGNGFFEVNPNFPVANNPSPHVAYGAFYTPPQVMIEFDPPVRKVEFYYSRLRGMNSSFGPGDSMMVYARSRTPGTLNYWTWDSKKIYSNVASTSPPYNVWTPITLQTGGGDAIQWLWFDGTIVIDDLKITRAKQDTTFHLTSTGCPSSAVRSDSINCTATWAPATIPASEISFAWRFKPDSVRVFPAANARPYDPPPAVDSIGQGMKTWAGRVVLGGRVELKATWQGDLDSTFKNVVVNSRATSGFGNLPVRLKPDTFDLVTNYNTILIAQGNPATEPLGTVADNIDSALTSSAFSEAITKSPKIRKVLVGPNRGYWYVDSTRVELNRMIRVRTWITGRTPTFFTYSPVPGVQLTNRGILNAKRKNGNKRMYPDSLAFLTGLVAHEGFGVGGRGHQARFQLVAASLPTCGKVPAILERVVGSDSVTAEGRTIDVLTEGWKSLGAGAGHLYVYNNWANNVPYYEVVPQITIADNLLAIGYPVDPQLPAPSPVFTPNPLWNCSRTY